MFFIRYTGTSYEENANKHYLVKKINSLHDKVAYSFEKDVGIGAASKQLAGIIFKKKTNMPEMREPQIELELINFLELSYDNGFEIILVFDELDKISLTVTQSSGMHTIDNIDTIDVLDNETIDETIYRRIKRVDSLLASLKLLITVGNARLFFIAGRDMLDSYQSEKGSTSSLYESLFDQVFEVPSFLTDNSDKRETRLHSMIEVYVCSRLLTPDAAENYWLANQLCGKLVNDDKFIGLLDKHNIKDEETCATFSNFIIDQLLIMLFGEKHFSCFKTYITRDDSKRKNNILLDFKNKMLNSSGSLQNDINLVSIIFFIRELLVLYLYDKETKNSISETACVKNINTHKTIKNYKIPCLNNYYIYLLHNNISKNDATIVINSLHQFINYLTIHSWGNCKRLSSLFESFIKPQSMLDSIHNAMNWLPTNEEKDYMLHFGVIERQRISMGSNLYIMFNHHLSRQFTGADKLLVSTMAAMHYCLKFHRSAFSRHHLFRMTEMMSIYSSPELNSIFETTLTQVIWPYIRVIRNGRAIGFKNS